LKLARGGVQVEIVANLFVMALAGLAVVTVAMAGLSLDRVREDARERLHMGARFLERVSGATKLADIAAIARASGPRLVGGEFTVLDEQGRELSLGDPRPNKLGSLRELIDDARRAEEVSASTGGVFGDLVLVRSVRSPAGEKGFLVGRIGGDELWQRFAPLLRAGAWVLCIAIAVFAGFGTWLLRRRVVAPLEELARGTRQVAAGDLRARIEPEGPAELAELAQAFNHMAESLEREREALDRAHESLSRSRRLASVGQLAAGVAHEVGNPVAAILGYAEVCQRDAGATERTRELSGRIADEALRIRALVREMLDLSRSDALALARAAPAQIVASVRQRLADQTLLSGIEFETRAEDALPEVQVDEARLAQVFVNLIENAAHALRGNPAPRIVLSASRAHDAARPARRASDRPGASFEGSRAPDAVAFEVTDNGPGIDPEHLPHVFDPFFTTKEPGEGTGLGLWNAHRIAELLGGKLDVASQSGRTCFRLTLPAADMNGANGQAPRADHR
jgi:signal transduction histidine kinase